MIMSLMKGADAEMLPAPIAFSSTDLGLAMSFPKSPETPSSDRQLQGYGNSY